VADISEVSAIGEGSGKSSRPEDLANELVIVSRNQYTQYSFLNLKIVVF
jgi:hypothetical protein